MAKRKKLRFDSRKVMKGSIRKAHFSLGGTLSSWRGRATSFIDKKKKQSRNFCRNNK